MEFINQEILILPKKKKKFDYIRFNYDKSEYKLIDIIDDNQKFKYKIVPPI